MEKRRAFWLIGWMCLGFLGCSVSTLRTAPTQTAAMVEPSMRLDPNVVPVRYAVTFDLDLEHGAFTGREVIKVDVARPTSVIYLHAVDLTVAQAMVANDAGTSQSARVTSHPALQQIGLNLSSPVVGKATIEIAWSAPMSDKLRGLYRKVVNGQAFAFTQFEPTDARKAFPCFDEPGQKARFALTVVVPAGNKVVSNVMSVSEHTADGKTTVEFAETPPLSTYLIAIAAGPLVVSPTVQSVGGVPIRVFTVPGKEKLAAFALVVAPQALDRLAAYFGLPYPYPKMDMIAVPDFANGAMENVGAVTFRESDFLIDPQTAGVSNQIRVFNIITHEFAHQWFGNLVTMKWWDDLWLNEAFATWMASKIVDEWKPEWTLWDAFENGQGGTLKKDALIATHPVRVPVTNVEEANANFDAITYTKGASVIHMLEQFLGEAAFRQGLNQYLRTHGNGNATSEDLWQALAAASHQPVETVATAWITQPGYPVVSVRSSCVEGHPWVELSQRRFLSNASHQAPEGLWPIPVCLRTEHEQSCFLLADASSRKALTKSTCSDSVLVNENRIGFYRVRYEREPLLRLAKTKLSVRERSMLIDDADALARARQLPLTVVLDLLRAIGADRSPYVNYGYTSILADLERMMDERDRASFRGLSETLFRPLLNQFGWSRRPTDSENDRLVRAQAIYNLGRLGRSPDVLAEARRLAPLYLKDRKSLDGDVGDRVLTLAALEGNAALYDQYLARLRQTQEPQEHEDILYSITRFEGPDSLARSLALMLTADVQQQDLVYVLGYMLRFTRLQTATWEFIKANFDALRRKADEHEFKYVIEQTGSFCTAEAAADVERFFADPAHRLSGGDRALKEALDGISICVAFRQAEGANLATWLRTQYPVSTSHASR